MKFGVDSTGMQPNILEISKNFTIYGSLHGFYNWS